MWCCLGMLVLLASSTAADLGNDDAELYEEQYDDNDIDDYEDDAWSNLAGWDVSMEKPGSQGDISGRKKKFKLKKKHKKQLMKYVVTGLIIKSIALPIILGFLKLLTGKAVLVTMMALGLVSALTYRGASEKTVTEVINLVPKKKHRSMTFSPEQVAEFLHKEF